MSNRFDAEQLLREACSNQIPRDGDFIVRGPNGWFFGNSDGPSGGGDPGDPGGGGPGGTISFSDILGNILNVQVGEAAVTQHEAALDILFTQLLGLIEDGQVPLSAVAQWQEYLEVDSKNFQGDLWDFVLRRTTSHRPWTSNDRCVANGALS